MEIIFGLFGCGMGLFVYVFMSFSIMTIATKTGTSDAWMAWIPILNIILLLRIAGKPLWWILLFVVPIANIIVQILMWMAVAERRGKPNWYGALILVPCIGIFLAPGLIAFSD